LTALLKPADALAHAVTLLIARGFAEVARNTRGDSIYLKPEGCAFALRVSNHARTPKQRRNHPDVLTSLVIRGPKTTAQVQSLAEVASRNFAAMLRARGG
jgi:hypothetical protein